MKDDLSRSFCFWRHEGFVVFQLGHDYSGRKYFLNIEGLGNLIDKQIGFKVNIEYYDNRLPEHERNHYPQNLDIKMQAYIDSKSPPDIFSVTDNDFNLSIVTNKEDKIPVLNLGKCAITRFWGDKIDSNLRVLHIDFTNTDDIPDMDEVKKFLDGITWHK